VRGHFDQIEPAFVRGGQRLLNRDDPQLFTRLGDDPDRTDPDLSVDTGPLFAWYGQWCAPSAKGNKKDTRAGCPDPPGPTGPG